MSNSVEFIIKARDEAGKVVKSLAVDIDKLVDAQEDAAKSAKKSGSAQKKFGDESGKASKKTKDLSESTKGLNANLGKVAGVAAAAFTALKTLQGIRDISKEFDLASKSADRLGLSLEDFQAGSQVALNFGSEDFTAGLDDLNERLQDFVSNGVGEAADVLKRFNLDAKELARLNPQEALLRIADAMKGISNNDRAQLLDQLGSDNLRNLEPLLRGGREEFERLAKAAKESGSIISEEDAIAISRLGKNLKETGGTLKGVFLSSLAKIAPILNSVVDSFSGIISKTSDFRKAGGIVFDTFAKLQQSITGLFLDSFQFVNKKSLELQLVLRKVISSVIGEINDIQKLTLKLPFVDTLPIDGLASASDRAARNVKNLETQIANLNNQKPLSEKFKERIEAERKAIEDEARRREEERKKASVDTSGTKRTGADKVAADAAKAESSALKDVLDLRNRIAEATIKRAKQTEIAKINSVISEIEQEEKLRIANIDKLEDLEKISSGEAALRRIDVEKDAVKKIAREREKLVLIDERKLQAQLLLLQGLQKFQKEGSEEQLTSAAKIAELQVQINDLEIKRANITNEVARKNALITIEKANQVQLNKKIAKEENAKKAKENAKLAEEEAKKKIELDRKVADAKRQLLRLEGNDLEANLLDIDDKYSDLVSELEKAGEDSSVIQKLIDKEKAQAELDDIREKMSDLVRDFEAGLITEDQFNARFDPNASKAVDLAGEIGNQGQSDDLTKQIDTARNGMNEMYELGQQLGQSFESSFTNAFASVIDGTQSVSDAFRQMAAQVVAELTKILLKQLLISAIGGGTGTSATGFFGGFSNGVSGGQFHGGGVVGAGGTARTVDPSWYFNAHKFHTGGVVGLKPNEVPAVLERGEEVLTRKDPRHALNGGKGNGGGNVQINNMISDSAMSKAMSGPAVSRVIENKILEINRKNNYR